MSVDSDDAPQQVELPAEQPDSVLLALDRLGGIATYEEMRRQLGDLARPRAKHYGLVWRRFGDVAIAIGGTGTSSKFRWAREFTELERRVIAVGSNPTVPKIRRAIEGSALKRFEFSRLAAVWEVLAEQISATPDKPGFRRTDSTPATTAPELPAPDFPLFLEAVRPASPTMVSDKESESSEATDKSTGVVSKETVDDPVGSASVVSRPPRSTFGQNRITLPPLSPTTDTSRGPSIIGNGSKPLRDKRLRVIMECEGHFIAGLYDENTGALQITTGVLARSTSYSTPTAAAHVVLAHFSQSDPKRTDGFALWTKTNGEPIPRPRN